ncbi:hypothetical protein DT076_08850 [Desertihabitans brevis]|uniref:Hydrolase n=1 Tax=Desertihabitans brevis TaxID=2268447 RepID=A0A367YWA0_9ACTN|nr:hypothetical protein [Desertihabitans brevis]RCK70090.1 hypothetical protein DT076_08850 [Desertihabitans brevis]
MATSTQTAPPWFCLTCGAEHALGPVPLEHCPICLDDRQYARPSGQRWAWLDEPAAGDRRVTVEEWSRPRPARAGCAGRSPSRVDRDAVPPANLLSHPVGSLDAELVDWIRELGGVAAIASSHPHMFGAPGRLVARLGKCPGPRQRPRRRVGR